MFDRQREGLVAYGVAVLATLITFAVRLLLWPMLGDAVPHMAFIPAVMIAAYYGGFRPGLLATLLGAFVANVVFTEPHYSLGIKTLNAAVAFPLFVLVGTIISGLSESLHRARRRIVADERQRAEEALRELEDRFRQMAENIHEIFWLMDARDDRFIYISRGYEDVWGMPRRSLYEQPRSWIENIHPDERDKAIAHMEQYKHGLFPDGEFRVVRPDGAIRWIRSRAFPIKDQKGDITRIAGLAEDITERKQTEEKLRQNEHRWRSLTEALPQLVWTATPDGSCDYFSTQWTQYSGVPEIHLLGWQWLELLHPDDREATRQLWTNSTAGRGGYDVEYRVRRLDGEYRWFKTRGVPIRDSEGGIFKWFGTCTDITDGKRVAEELRRAKEAAESANRAKDEFLANVSHEIRTPFGAIIGMTELVLDTSLTENQRQYLEIVKSASHNLLDIINDLLDFAKIEAGKLELDSDDFSLREAVGNTLRILAIRAHKKGLELVSHVQPDVPDLLIGDAGRLRQVLLNLVGNAIKFTEAGEVVVEVGLEIGPLRPIGPVGPISELQEASLRFTVRDTGIGIPADKQEKIFRAFEQEDTSTTRRYGGTGLGLTIAARLVALMDGKISVDSEPGRGSTFTFTAHFGRQPHHPERVAALPSGLLDNLAVLIVDDNATNRHILEEWLRRWQMEPVGVGDGVAAMDTLRDAATLGHPYPLVLLDARMPDTDGLALAAKIRKRDELSATRIILLTSGNIPGDLARPRELRIDAHLLKPVQQDDLLKTIHRVMSRPTEGVGSGQSVAGSQGETSGSSLPAADLPLPTDKPLRILIAEDNEFNAQLLEQLFVRRGHRVRLATNGREALSLLGVRNQGSGVRGQESETTSLLTPDSCSLTPDFDVLLLDIHMPELDGFQVIQAIREREQATGEHLPVIALTARSRKEDRERCLAVGMDDFLAKPIQAADLWAAIARIRNPESGIPSQESGARVSRNSDSSSLTPDFGLLDSRVLLAACGDDAGILEKICQAFRTRLPDHLTAVQDALRERDTVRLREAAHKLCGMVLAFSTVAGGVASDLEDQAAQGKLEEAQPLVGQLTTMADELVRLTSGLSLETLYRRSGHSEKPNGTDGT